MATKKKTSRSVKVAAFDKNYAKTGQVSYRGSGRSAAYRGAANSKLKAGKGSRSANRAGMAADRRAASQGGS
jgi:hypothetical protein